jgi:hypothetical protein
MSSKTQDFEVPDELPDDDCGDFDEDQLDENCPNCGREYDEIDWEYQICHHCKFNNNE